VRPPDDDQAAAWLAERHAGLTPADRERALALAAGAPLAASDLLESDGLDFGQRILSGLLQVARGGPVSAAVGDDWLARPDLTWRWLAVWMAAFMRQAQGLPGTELPDQVALPRPVSAERLAALWERTLQGRQMADTTVRHDLLMGKWLLEWARIFPSGQ